MNPEEGHPPPEMAEIGIEQTELIDKVAEFVPSVQLIEHKQVAQRLVDEINAISSEFEQEITRAGGEPNPGLKLQGVAGRLSRRIWNLFHTSNPEGENYPTDLKREQWSITKEFLQGLKKFNEQIRQVNQLFGTNVEAYNEYYFSQIQEAEDISAGRLLTHTASNETMYQILERGNISSISEQVERYGDSKRTHEAPNPHMGQRETHDLCFNVDSVYINFSDDEESIKHGTRRKSNIVLLLSENAVLNKRQYVDFDGRHVFDENFTGDTPDSPGLSIDLRATPFMLLVSESERDNLAQFLKDNSAFREILASMDAQQQSDWLANHLITTPSIVKFKFTPEIKARFFGVANIEPSKGFVELTDTEAGFKAGVAATKRFTAFAT